MLIIISSEMNHWTKVVLILSASWVARGLIEERQIAKYEKIRRELIKFDEEMAKYDSMVERCRNKK
jgi:hypothetical protein